MIWLVIIILIVCATILAAMYFYYADSNGTGCFARHPYYPKDETLQELKEQQQQLINEIQELKTIIKEQNSVGGFKIL